MKEQLMKNIEELIGQNDPETVSGLYERYRQTLQNAVQEMQEAFDAKDMKKLRESAHSIKGCAMSIAHEEVRKAAYTIEMGAKDENPPVCDAPLKRLARISEGMEQ